MPHACRVLDYFLGYLIFLVLFILAVVMLPDRIQAALLFNIKFSKALDRAKVIGGRSVTDFISRALERQQVQFDEQKKAQEGGKEEPKASASRGPLTTA